jgi:hypothetical protein
MTLIGERRAALLMRRLPKPSSDSTARAPDRHDPPSPSFDPPMPIDFRSRVKVPPDVMVSELGGESVLLNLRTESYFGLDDVGTSFWAALSSQPTIDAAVGKLLEEFETDEATVRNDVSSFLDSLVTYGLVEIVAP